MAEEEVVDKQEDVAGCWSAANSGTNARLRPLNIMAGSGESKRVRESNYCYISFKSLSVLSLVS